MTKAEDFIKRGKCKNNHCSSMSTSAWCDLNKNCTVLKLHGMCYNPKCKCHKHITFTPKQFQLEGAGFKNTMKKIFKVSQTAWNKNNKNGFGLKMVTPIISAAVAAKTKNPQSAQVMKSILKSLTGGKILSLTDMHGQGLRLKVM